MEPSPNELLNRSDYDEPNNMSYNLTSPKMQVYDIDNQSNY
jgi:hypothetical protein